MVKNGLKSVISFRKASTVEDSTVEATTKKPVKVSVKIGNGYLSGMVQSFSFR